VNTRSIDDKQATPKI